MFPDRDEQNFTVRLFLPGTFAADRQIDVRTTGPHRAGSIALERLVAENYTVPQGCALTVQNGRGMEFLYVLGTQARTVTIDVPVMP